MSLVHYLFGFSGRINRAKQWAVLLVSLVHSILLGIAFSMMIGAMAVFDVVQGKTSLAAFLLDRSVFIYERPLFVSVTLQAGGLARRRCPQLLSHQTTVLIVAVGTFHAAFRNLMMERLRE